jgi:hypothetical protein
MSTITLPQFYSFSILEKMSPPTARGPQQEVIKERMSKA